jgi:uncharacterized protein (TIGR03118 family)
LKKTAAAAASVVLGLLATSALAAPRPLSDVQLSHIVAGEKFIVVGEVSDTMVENGNPADPSLQNAWGISQGPATPIWVSDNNTGVSTLYSLPSFSKVPLTVVIPIGSATPAGSTGTPTGTTFTDLNFATPEFEIMQGGALHHALFLFDTEDGTISGWAFMTADPTHASIAVDESTDHAVFKGLTLANVGVGNTVPELYAANFHSNEVEVFNSDFQKIGQFTDTSLPPGYAPFNVQQLNGKLYVSFAVQKPDLHDEVDGAGLGFVDVFDLQGNKIATLVGNGPSSKLNAPWGLAIAPASFGSLAGALLVGNFGDGAINAYDPNTGKFLGTLKTTGENSIRIDGLWALRVSSDGELVFSSGPNGEQDGLIGVIKPASAPASWAFQSHVQLGR